MTGSSTLPLNDLTWELIDASTGAALVTGTYLDSVAPNADGSWSWSHNLSGRPGCPAGSWWTLVLLTCSGMNWWCSSVVACGHPLLTQPIGDVVFDADDPHRGPPIAGLRRKRFGAGGGARPASSTGVCKSPPTLATFPLVTDVKPMTVVLNPLD